jgi:RNA polymerase sigma-70 factor (ECF subfamily)
MSGKLLPFRRTRPDTVELSDEALLAACAAGDPTALGELFDRYDDAVRRFLSRACAMPVPDLDDLVHATFVEVYRSAGRFRGKASAKTWIFGVAVNVSRHFIRSETRRRRFLVNFASVPRSESRPQEAIENRQILNRITSALAGLPPTQRVAFVLCELEGLTGAEAARAMGLRQGTLGRQLHNARKALRAVVEGGAP